MKPMHHPGLPISRARGAFTLIEMLVALAIVAILAALAGTAWEHSQRGARAAQCKQNLRSIGAGLIRYVGEHDGTFPTLVLARDNKDQDVPTLDTVLASYVPDKRVFACPADTRKLAETTGTSYLWNIKLNGQRIGGMSVAFVKGAPLDDPGRIMVLGDKEGFHPSLASKVNVLYADGHASQELTFINPEDLP